MKASGPALEIALFVGAGLVAAYLLKKAGGAVGDAVSTAADAINPLNQDNIWYQGVNAVGGAIATEPTSAGKNADGSWTLGGWLYDVTHPATAAAVADTAGGATGGW